MTKEKKAVLLSGIVPGTFSVLDRCDNHYTTKTYSEKGWLVAGSFNLLFKIMYFMCIIPESPDYSYVFNSCQSTAFYYYGKPNCATWGTYVPQVSK